MPIRNEFKNVHHNGCHGFGANESPFYESITQKKWNDFILSGLITDEDGVPYWGASFKYGAHQYYQSKGTFRRFSREALDTKVCNRVKQYLRESGTVEKELQKSEVELKKLIAKKDGLKRHFKGVRLKEFLNRTCVHFDTLDGKEKRRIIRAVLPIIMIRSNNKLALFVNPDPDSVWKGRPIEGSSSELSCPTITVEDESSKNKTNGCGGRI